MGTRAADLGEWNVLVAKGMLVQRSDIFRERLGRLFQNGLIIDKRGIEAGQDRRRTGAVAGRQGGVDRRLGARRP